MTRHHGTIPVTSVWSPTVLLRTKLGPERLDHAALLLSDLMSTDTSPRQQQEGLQADSPEVYFMYIHSHAQLTDFSLGFSECPLPAFES